MRIYKISRILKSMNVTGSISQTDKMLIPSIYRIYVQPCIECLNMILIYSLCKAFALLDLRFINPNHIILQN